MRQLLLLRHAKSAWDDPALSDHARPLNARGRRAAGAMGAAMRGLGLSPALILVSSSRRTLQTLEGLGEIAPGGARTDPMDDLYLAGWARLLDAVREAPPETRCLLLIAHNPGLHEFALHLAGDDAASGSARPSGQALAEAYPTGALAEFAVEGDWAGLSPATARMIRFLQPRDLPEMAQSK